MSFIGKFVRTAVLGAACRGAAVRRAAGFAQEISASHLAAALDVVQERQAHRAASTTSCRFSPARSSDRLIRVRPDLHKEIADAVEAVAAEARRPPRRTRQRRRPHLGEELHRGRTADASRRSTRARPARSSPTSARSGQPRSYQAVRRWSDRVGEELLEKTREELKSQGIEF